MGALSGLQQAAIAAIQQAMGSMDIPAMLKQAAENLPPEIQENVLQIGQKVASFQAQLDRIEAQNQYIISLLQQEKPNGQAARAIEDASGGNVERLSGAA